ncbi:MAG: hypothetical protein DWQ20_00810 [Actinobacteria bacterium]|nr:MAG: hypothetical protein DWQ20_00810 [Actinomycetota bacterium]
MAIYGRFGSEVRVLGYATGRDIVQLEGRKLDQQDRNALAIGSYVLCQRVEDGARVVQHQAYMRADDGAREIGKALLAADPEGHKVFCPSATADEPWRMKAV